MILLSDKTREFIDQSPVPLFVDGIWRVATKKRTSRIENPAKKNELCSVSKAEVEDVEQAITSADTAFQEWKEKTPHQRAELLQRFADFCEEDAEVLAQLEALDVGKAIENARSFDVPFGIDSLRYYSKLIEQQDFEQQLSVPGMNGKSVRIPYGVVAFIFPWNFPLTLCLWGIGPALAAGNTVVIKPAEITPLSTLYLGKLAQAAGIPDGVINIIPGSGPEIGPVLTSHPKVKCLSFTGSSTVGRNIAQQCGYHLKPTKLELGGKGAAVIFEDADLDAAAEGLAGAITLNTGQVCCTATRWVVQEEVMDTFIKKIKHELEKVTIGEAMDENTQMGPVVSAKQLRTIKKYIEKGQKDGAEIIFGGEINEEKGYFVTPTLLQGQEDNICFKEEIFGPVAYLTTFTTETDAVRQVNSLDYGLANSVWTTNEEKADRVARAMEAGNSWVNAHNVFAYGLPYGGINGSGNGGGVNSIDTLFDYTRQLSIAEPITESTLA